MEMNKEIKKNRTQVIDEVVKKLNPIDDPMFLKMAEDRNFCQEILGVILEDPGLKVVEQAHRIEATNAKGNTVAIDVKCSLGDQRIVNVGILKPFHDEDDEVDDQRLVLYYGSILSANLKNQHEDCTDVPDVCMVCISNMDVFGLFVSICGKTYLCNCRLNQCLASPIAYAI